MQTCIHHSKEGHAHLRRPCGRWQGSPQGVGVCLRGLTTYSTDVDGKEDELQHTRNPTARHGSPLTIVHGTYTTSPVYNPIGGLSHLRLIQPGLVAEEQRERKEIVAECVQGLAD